MATDARRCAYTVVRRVFEQDAYADRAFRAEADRHSLVGRDRAFAMQLELRAVQRRDTIDHVIRALSERPPERIDPAALAALRLGVYQLLFMDGVAAHAAVTESVDLARAAGSRGHGFVNAVLRRVAREGGRIVDSLGESTPSASALRHSHPEWLAEMWWRELGPGDALALMRADNEPPESAVRVNTLRASRDELLAELERDGVGARPPPHVAAGIVRD